VKVAAASSAIPVVESHEAFDEAGTLKDARAVHSVESVLLSLCQGWPSPCEQRADFAGRPLL